MKKFIIVSVLAAALASTLGFAGCELELPDEPVEPEQPLPQDPMPDPGM